MTSPPLQFLLLLATKQGLQPTSTGSTHRVGNEYYRLGMTVDDDVQNGHTYLSELSINQDLFPHSAGFGWTANLLFNYSQRASVSNRGRLSGTALVTLGPSGVSTWHAPVGGHISHHNLTAITVSGVALGTVAAEEWQVAVEGPTLTWGVSRVMLEDVVATCDRMPTLVFNAEYTTTGHVLHTSAQIPSFLDATLRWDPLSGVGFQCGIGGYPASNRDRGGGGWSGVSRLESGGGGRAEGGSRGAPLPSPGIWTEAVTNRTAQEIMLSPSSIKWKSRGTRASSTGSSIDSSSASASALMFALTYPTAPGTGGGDTVMALGYTTMEPPGHSPPPPGGGGPRGWWGEFIIVSGVTQYYVPPGNTTKYHILAADCGTAGEGYFQVYSIFSVVLLGNSTRSRNCPI
jgi:hypothetical protein